MMTTDLNVEMYRALARIADDENLMKQAVSFVKSLVKSKKETDATSMTKDDNFVGSGSQTPQSESVNQEPSIFKAETKDKIFAEVAAYVEGEKAFLNPHLSLSDLAQHCSYGQTYISKVLKEQHGGFFNYVNKLRLEYSDEYRSLHPNAIIDDIAERCGFASRQSYYNARKRLG